MFLFEADLNIEMWCIPGYNETMIMSFSITAFHAQLDQETAKERLQYLSCDLLIALSTTHTVEASFCFFTA